LCLPPRGSGKVHLVPLCSGQKSLEWIFCPALASLMSFLFRGGKFLITLATTLAVGSSIAAAENHREILLEKLTAVPQTLTAPIVADTFTWWLPRGADTLILPMAAGIVVDKTNAPLRNWLAQHAPWDLTDLPVVAARYGDQTLVVIVPWPHYAQLLVDDRVGVRFTFPTNRNHATPCDLVAARRDSTNLLEAALVFRTWRAFATKTGAIPKPRPLAVKAAALPAVTNLFGAAHFYLWGPALFSRHDVDRQQWGAVARELWSAPTNSFCGRLVARFSAAQKANLRALSQAEWPDGYLTASVAAAIDAALTEASLLDQPTNRPLAEVVRRNSAALGAAWHERAHDPVTWGDGFSVPLLESLRAAGVNRALLLLNDFYARAPRPDVTAKAEALGFLIGPYDAYHGVHDPASPPDATWETAQFDAAAYHDGRIQNADGSGHKGFRNRGFHFSPLAAWPYVQRRVTGRLRETPFNAWFVDCDATAECFDDYNPLHPATRVDDIAARRARLHWLETDEKLVVGSEGGSALFADVIHFGHGIATPYIGHLAKEFKDPNSPCFMGKYWPAEGPDIFFKPITVPASLRSPYFDPGVRIPLYQAALGDELLVSHHWNFDSLKFGDVTAVRELLELLYLTPPLYHLNRQSWPNRRERIVKHFQFWSPLHQQLAAAPLVKFEWLDASRKLQRTTFRPANGAVTVTVNFSATAQQNYPPHSATVSGAISVPQTVYQAGRP